MDASSRDNRTAAIHEGVRRKSEYLLFYGVRRQHDLRRLHLRGETFPDYRSFLPLASRATPEKCLNNARLLVVFTYHSSTYQSPLFSIINGVKKRAIKYA
jgi:hypothetical protein